MELGMIGLGKMGGNMVRRLMRGGNTCAVYDRNPAPVDELAKVGARGVKSLQEFVSALKKPRAVWLMLPAGEITEKTVIELSKLLEPGDTLIDGGNSYYKDDVRRARMLEPRSLHYIDVGTSGGVYGIDRGYCLMIGGPRDAVQRLDPIFKTLAPGRGDVEPSPSRNGGGTAEEGYLYCGPSGAGHFVKMVHNGIEYGLMQAYAEGFDILFNANSKALADGMRYDFNMEDIAELWRRGSVVGSWLLDLTADAMAENPGLTRFSGFVEDSGEGRWTVQAAIDESVPADVLTASLFARFRSRKDHTFAEKCLSAMRYKFGGHVEATKA